jgi:hypothetical protein
MTASVRMLAAAAVLSFAAGALVLSSMETSDSVLRVIGLTLAVFYGPLFAGLAVAAVWRRRRQ